MAQQALVIGGGIAGLSAAASLLQTGWRVRVLERSAELGEVGAGLAVTVNGMRALAVIGAADAVRAAGYAVRPAGARRADGTWLLKASDSPDELSRMVGIHRQRLHQALASVCDAELITNARVTAVSEAGVSWESPTGLQTGTADLVVGADGIRSVVRKSLFPEHHLTYSGYSSWRAVVDDSTSDADRFAMVWGKRAEFGALRISPTQIYWYGYVALPPGHRFADELQATRDYFANWAPDVRALVNQTQPEQLLRHDVWELAKPLPRYTQGRIVLIGDAAHPMLPTLGQGANSALEDGVTLGIVGLKGFEAARYRRTQQLVSRSVQMARTGAHLGSGQWLRNALLRVVPAGTAQRSGTRIMDWHPPAG
jgi:2-polyprenyl-6-methoxyphenol hydroxylase-like FAD-dependent oxidoreductase